MFCSCWMDSMEAYSAEEMSIYRKRRSKANIIVSYLSPFLPQSLVLLPSSASEPPAARSRLMGGSSTYSSASPIAQ